MSDPITITFTLWQVVIIVISYSVTSVVIHMLTLVLGPSVRELWKIAKLEWRKTLNE